MKRSKWRATFAAVACLCSNYVLAAAPGDYRQNAAYLSYGYLHSLSYSSNCDLAVPRLCPTFDFAYRASNFYHVSHWFLHVGNLNDVGRISADTRPIAAANFLNALANYENHYQVRFTVLASFNRFNGETTLDLADASVRSAIVDECMKLVSTATPGSYISGANRAFDGVSIDIEPTGRVNGDDRYFNNMKLLMAEIRRAFRSRPELAGKKTAVASFKFGQGDRWYWNAAHYHYMARYVDYMTAMTYDTAISTTGTDYANWVATQTESILSAVSGRYWNFDAEHPAPTNGVKVFIGFPAYPDRQPNHYRTIETTPFAAQGTFLGLNRNPSPAKEISNSYFQGAVMYVHDTGRLVVDQETGQPNLMKSYATIDYDWWWWGRHWVGAW